MAWRFVRGLFQLQVRSNFLALVAVALSLWALPAASGVIRFLLVAFLGARANWNMGWLVFKMGYYARHPEEDTIQGLPRTFTAATARAIEILVVMDALFDAAADIVEQL